MPDRPLMHLSLLKKQAAAVLTMHVGAPKEQGTIRWLNDPTNAGSEHISEVARSATLLWPHHQDLFGRVLHRLSANASQSLTANKPS